ncbi:hypothetical protein TraAM80_04865 [Trypanosoma rangeli]|uniref:Uncharacterized protein n=1 Tax=Trypanosoma rangeli TaxID=5698 RepID=A0A422NGV1_TRYRA|nr:uncharacterized protein TraAM80_04865 [Trypanosoma rangeli]RNF04669.1 hypothetical protein TraAM80_04865 [Trypanosoma rangeli]|eukprot:RNF04669.1 hypothetical protein TraAM80_04865 [Trypanosoma rangeli]
MSTFTSDTDEAAAREEWQQRLGKDAAVWEEGALRHRWRKAAAKQRHINISDSGRFTFAPNFSLHSHTRQSHAAGDERGALEKTRRLVERDGAHTVLYNPIATDPKTFSATLQKLK